MQVVKILLVHPKSEIIFGEMSPKMSRKYTTLSLFSPSNKIEGFQKRERAVYLRDILGLIFWSTVNLIIFPILRDRNIRLFSFAPHLVIALRCSTFVSFLLIGLLFLLCIASQTYSYRSLSLLNAIALVGRAITIQRDIKKRTDTKKLSKDD